MSAIEGRDELEGGLTKKLARALKGILARLLVVLGDPPNLFNVTASFWDEAREDLTGVISPELLQVYLDQAKKLMDETTIGVDWALVNQRAIDWSRGYTYDLVTGINNTSRRLLQSNVSRYFEQGLTIGDLEASLSGVFGPIRAEMIAVTEITRAASEGEQALADEIREMGIDMLPVWETNDDELVCPLCGPRDGKIITDGEFPPLHPRCRCFTSHRLKKVKA